MSERRADTGKNLCADKGFRVAVGLKAPESCENPGLVGTKQRSSQRTKQK
jgi:hypothetical protein